MRKLCLLIAASAALALPEAATASCSATVRWQGVTYHGIPAPQPLDLGARVAGGMVPGCDDHIVRDEHGNRLNPPPPDRPVDLRAIAGVPTIMALGRADAPRIAYLAPGFFPELPNHPLHDVLFGSPRRPKATAAGCVPKRGVRGRVVQLPAGYSFLLVENAQGQKTRVVVDARTRFRGGRRVLGHPRLVLGDRVRVGGSRCPDALGSFVVARRIRPTARPSRAG